MENPLDGIEQIAQIADPVERAMTIGARLGAIPAFQERLRAMRQAAIKELRAQGWSYAKIGDALGLHRNRIQQIAEGRPGGGKGGVHQVSEPES